MGTETSKYHEEKKLTRIPLVTASEAGRAHNVNLCNPLWVHRIVVWRSTVGRVSGPSLLEKGSREGETPVLA